MTGSSTVPVDRLETGVYQFPTDAPESDGTLAWDCTTMILVKAFAGNRVGVGYTYAGPAAASVITGTLAPAVHGQDALRPTGVWALMQHRVRNLGKPGLVAQAISAVDIALWDLYARLVDLPLSVALGAVHEQVPLYGSGGFTGVEQQWNGQWR